jgi:hypothetical protein
VLAATASWQAGLVVSGMLLALLIVLLMVALVHGQLTQWQHRRTLMALVRNAPQGTVVVHRNGDGGPSTRIQVGKGGSASRKGPR